MQVSTPHTGSFAHPKRNVSALGIQGGMQIADFGAGSGAYVFAIAERLGGTGRIYAIDVQRDLLRRISNEATRRGYSNVEVIWADLEVPKGSKLAEQSIDFVLVSNLLFQVPDRSAILREARRIVKPHGSVALIDWSASFGGLGPMRDEVVTKEAALEEAGRAGLAPVREFHAGAHHWGLLMRPVYIAAR